jgi:hypothetical protein
MEFAHNHDITGVNATTMLGAIERDLHQAIRYLKQKTADTESADTESADTESAAVAASQLISHFGGKVTVKARGSTVTISSPQGIKESDWAGARLILPTTVTAPKMTKSVVTMKNHEDGDWEALDDSAPAATSVLNKELRATGKTAQASAVTTGATAYSVSFPALNLVDGVTSALGEPTAGKPKKVNAATLVFGC